MCPTNMTNSFNKTWLIITLLVNGAAIIVLEILGTRIIAPYFGTTLYVWTALIVVTLAALALGYFIGGKLADKRPDWKVFFSLFFIACILFLIIPLIDGFILNITSNLGIMWGPLVAALLLFFLPLSVLGMVTPFAVRLRTKSVENVGKRVGNFYAISTVGSIVGALVVAYCLIPNFKISVILFGSAGVLFLVSAIWFVTNKKGIIPTISVLLVGFLLVMVQPAEKADADILAQQQSFYGDVQVKMISSDLTCIVVNNVPQSCYNPGLDGSASAYIKIITSVVDMLENPKKVLIIGDGGGLITYEILKNHEVSITAVDIDQNIFEFGKEYLGFVDQPQVKKIVADGRAFLQNSTDRYDAILMDVISGTGSVPHLYTREMFELAQSKLQPDGILVVNSFGFTKGNGIEIIRSIEKTMADVFSDVAVASSCNIEEEEQKFCNFIFFAADTDLPQISRTVELEISGNIKIITDDHNSVEYLSIPIAEELLKMYAP